MLLYKRKAILRIVSTTGSVREIEGLRTQFEVTKTVLSNSNQAMITLTNPNSDTVAACQEKFATVELLVGYGDNQELLFTGQIRNVLQPRTQVETFAIIYASDAGFKLQNTYFSKTFESSVDIKQIIQEISSSFEGVAKGAINGLPQPVADKLRGISFAGKSKDLLDTLGAQYDFNWSIDNNEINIVPSGGVIPGRQIVIVNSETGLIESPIITEIGVDFRMLINPAIGPDTRFRITSKSASSNLPNGTLRKFKNTTAQGDYKAIEIVSIGDTRGNIWENRIKGRSLNV